MNIRNLPIQALDHTILDFLVMLDKFKEHIWRDSGPFLCRSNAKSMFCSGHPRRKPSKSEK